MNCHCAATDAVVAAGRAGRQTVCGGGSRRRAVSSQHQHAALAASRLSCRSRWQPAAALAAQLTRTQMRCSAQAQLANGRALRSVQGAEAAALDVQQYGLDYASVQTDGATAAGTHASPHCDVRVGNSAGSVQQSGAANNGPTAAAADNGDDVGPSHVALILDGNARWAAARGLPTSAGHAAGVDALRRTVRFVCFACSISPDTRLLHSNL